MLNPATFNRIFPRRFVRANRIPAVSPPRAPRLSAPERRRSGSTLTLFALARIAFAAILAALAPPLAASVREVGPIGLTVSDLGRELNFFTNTLSFELISVSDASGREHDALLGLTGARLRVATLKLGDERITLTQHLGGKGRPIPRDSRSFDRWFQHIAIVVSDMDKAYARLLERRVAHVSTAPQTLPDWNKDAGGIKAFYFRDPEDHVLEIIWFPPGKGNPKWRRLADGPESGRPLFLGIDHTAIVVSDTDASLAFYRDQLGFKAVGGAHNHGPEQEHLNQVFGARLRITALQAERGPGIELLEYIAPPGGRDLPPDAKANDLIFWNTRLLADDPSNLSDRLREAGVRFVSRRSGSKAQIVRDPDGHALTFQAASSPSPASDGAGKSIASGGKTLVFTDNKGVALGGCDPVAYFTDGAPRRGDANIEAAFNGARYRFVSRDNRAAFEKDPAKYAPAYGGFCGYAASVGKVRPSDPRIWSIVDGRLIVQHTQGADELWKKDVAGNKAKADKYWPHLIAAKAGKKNPVDSLLGKSALNLAEIN